MSVVPGTILPPIWLIVYWLPPAHVGVGDTVPADVAVAVAAAVGVTVGVDVVVGVDVTVGLDVGVGVGVAPQPPTDSTAVDPPPAVPPPTTKPRLLNSAAPGPW